MYFNAENKILLKGQTSDAFSIDLGVRQGCVLSPLLFLLVLDEVMVKTNTAAPNGLQWAPFAKLNDLDYADDLCLLAHSFEHINEKLQALHQNALKVGLRINTKKTKVMRINTNNTNALLLNDTIIEDVQSFSYLGCTISTNSGADEDVANRIDKARKAMYSLRKVWISNDLSRDLKLKIFNTCIKPILLYGCETLGLNKCATRRLQTFANRCLRRIIRCFWPNTISNSELLHKTKQTPIHQDILRRKFGWIGHTLRSTNTIAKAALTYNPQGSRRRGRPRTTWRTTTLNQLSLAQCTWNEAVQIAPDRNRWKSLIEAVCSQAGE